MRDVNFMNEINAYFNKRYGTDNQRYIIYNHQFRLYEFIGEKFTYVNKNTAEFSWNKLTEKTQKALMEHINHIVIKHNISWDEIMFALDAEYDMVINNPKNNQPLYIIFNDKPNKAFCLNIEELDRRFNK